MPDLFDFFKQNEDNIQEKPSEQAWQKLEQKLERNRRPKRRGIRFMQTWVVVLMLLILILAAMMVWHYARR
jgi:type VI protein secretion system component VasF